MFNDIIMMEAYLLLCDGTIVGIFSNKIKAYKEILDYLDEDPIAYTGTNIDDEFKLFKMPIDEFVIFDSDNTQCFEKGVNIKLVSYENIVTYIKTSERNDKINLIM